MTITSRTIEPGIVAVTVDFPPVNAIPSRGWFELADALTAAGDNPDTHAVILRAEGRGFNAGVDIKEMQRTEGFTALIDANRGCFAAFRAVYECAVPVIAAVNGFCVGGGIGLVGNADVIVASEDATFGLPEVERGALGAATHLSRLVPQHMMRRLFFTAATVDATIPCTTSDRCTRWCHARSWTRRRYGWPATSPPKTPGSSAPLRKR